MTSRSLACEALVRVEAGAYSHIVVPALLRGSNLEARDRAQVTDLVYGTLRAQRRIDDLLAQVSARDVSTLDPRVRAALRLGARQLLQGVPAHAAVGETVGVAPRRGRGYVNATLRSLARLGPPWPEPAADAVALSYPDWLVDRLRADLGTEDARAALEAGNEPGALTLRPNPRRTEPGALRAELEASGARVVPGELVPDALVVGGAGDPAALPAVVAGRATPQDQGSQAVVELLALERGHRVLDAAAAPGGKATAVAERVGDSGFVLAADVNAGRLRLVRDAAIRLGLDNLATVIGDGRRLPVRAETFDRVLVDAPCSGLGVLRRRPEARWRVTPDTITELARLQRELLADAAGAVRPGGMLLYAVCTLTAAETSEVGADLVAALRGWSVLEPPGAPWKPHGPGALLLPQSAGTDGMYVLRLRRGAG